MLARQIGMGAERVEAIRYAGMLHDVGKLGVPTKVLQKTGPLTEEELAAIQLHPMRGLEIVRQIGFLNEALDGIMHHHERMDGKGYPMGLAGDEIPEFARVIAVADAFDSMTSTRSYRGRPERRGGRRGAAQVRRASSSTRCWWTRSSPRWPGSAGSRWRTASPRPRRCRPIPRPGRGPGSRRPDRAAAGRREPLRRARDDDATAPRPPVRLAVHGLRPAAAGRRGGRAAGRGGGPDRRGGPGAAARSHWPSAP